MRFLSDEHLQAVTETMAADAEIRRRAEGVRLGLNYAITGGPEGDFGYYIQVADGVVTMALGELEDADANLKSTYMTAAAVSQGTLTSQMAVLTGRIKVRGAVGPIMKNTALLGLVEAATSAPDLEY